MKIEQNIINKFIDINDGVSIIRTRISEGKIDSVVKQLIILQLDYAVKAISGANKNEVHLADVSAELMHSLIFVHNAQALAFKFNISKLLVNELGLIKDEIKEVATDFINLI